jgi:HlyD family secretion protein
MLVDKQFIAQSEADKARALVNTMTEALKSVEAQLGVTSAQIKRGERRPAAGRAGAGPHRPGAHPDHLARQRHRDQARAIRARRWRPAQAPELFVIAEPQDMQVDASIDEATWAASALASARRSQSMPFPARPSRARSGRCASPQNVANVVTYVAVVRFSSRRPVVAGMTPTRW